MFLDGFRLPQARVGNVQHLRTLVGSLEALAQLIEARAPREEILRTSEQVVALIELCRKGSRRH